jgi:hypothetical protein
MKKITIAVLMLFSFSIANAQTERQIEVESKVETSHETTIKGKKVPYKATAGTQPVWDEGGKPIASLPTMSGPTLQIKLHDRLWFPSMGDRDLHRFGCIWPSQGLKF